MKEYFVVTNSFAAPFVSDTDEQYVKGKSPKDALKKIVQNYTHPCGLYAANLQKNADAKYKGEEPLVKWICNQALMIMNITKKKGSYSYDGLGLGKFKIDGETYVVENPKGGQFQD